MSYIQGKILLILIIGYCISMNTVKNLDLKKFMGKWYVIANIPNFIEKNHQNSLIKLPHNLKHFPHLNLLVVQKKMSDFHLYKLHQLHRQILEVPHELQILSSYLIPLIFA